MMLLSLALAFSGFTALCLAMDKHQLEPSGTARAAGGSTRRIGWAGWTLLAAALAAAVLARGWAVGAVLWLGAMTLGGIVITYGLLPYRPRWIKPLAYALPIAAGLLWLLEIG